jgi:hypothetical protein
MSDMRSDKYHFSGSKENVNLLNIDGLSDQNMLLTTLNNAPSLRMSKDSLKKQFSH